MSPFVTALVVNLCLATSPSDCQKVPLVVARGPVADCEAFVRERGIDISKRFEERGAVVTGFQCIALDPVTGKALDEEPM